jgi:DNA-binding PadR family transcriptional regulator
LFVRLSKQTVSVLRALRKNTAAWSYGYHLSKATGTKSGTLYPILTRLHDEGWLETNWTQPQQGGRPPRHLYRLTSTGLKEARRILSRKAAKKQFTRLALEG